MNALPQMSILFRCPKISDTSLSRRCVNSSARFKAARTPSSRGKNQFTKSSPEWMILCRSISNLRTSSSSWSKLSGRGPVTNTQSSLSIYYYLDKLGGKLTNKHESWWREKAGELELVNHNKRKQNKSNTKKQKKRESRAAVKQGSLHWINNRKKGTNTKR